MLHAKILNGHIFMQNVDKEPRDDTREAHKIHILHVYMHNMGTENLEMILERLPVIIFCIICRICR